MVARVRNRTVERMRGKVEEGYTYHGTSVLNLRNIIENGELRPHEGYEGGEGVYVTPWRRGIRPEDLYLGRGGTVGSVPVILRIDHDRLPEKVRKSFVSSGPQHSRYIREIPLGNIDYFDFERGAWKPLKGYMMELDEQHTLANQQYQRKAKDIFKVGGEEAIASAAARIGMGEYPRIREGFKEAGFTPEQSTLLALAKALELRADRLNPMAKKSQ